MSKNQNRRCECLSKLPLVPPPPGILCVSKGERLQTTCPISTHASPSALTPNGAARPIPNRPSLFPCFSQPAWKGAVRLSGAESAPFHQTTPVAPDICSAFQKFAGGWWEKKPNKAHTHTNRGALYMADEKKAQQWRMGKRLIMAACPPPLAP